MINALNNHNDHSLSAIIDKYDHFIFDCDGVLWHGDSEIGNSADVLYKLVMVH